MYDALHGVLYENAFILDHFSAALVPRRICDALLGWIPLERVGAWVAIRNTICVVVDDSTTLELRLTCLRDCLCGGSRTIFVGRLQNRLTTLLLLLHWIIEGTCSTRWRWHSSEGRCVQLIKLVVVLIELDTGSFGSVLRNIGHLLLFGEHLNLHLLLLGEGHEVIEDVFCMIFILYQANCRHIFVHLTLAELKVSTFIWAIPSIKILPDIRQVTTHARCRICSTEVLR